MDYDARIQQLERERDLLHATTLFQTFAHAVLYSIVREIGASSESSRANIDKVYRDTLKAHTERYLAGLADSQPAFAARLREILKAQLDQQKWPGETSV